MSLIFYMWSSPQYLLVMIGVIIINYFVGIYIDKYDKTGGAKCHIKEKDINHWNSSKCISAFYL